MNEEKINFAKNLCECILTDGLELEVTEVHKNNDTTKVAIIARNDAGIAPTFYIDDAYDRYTRGGESMKAIAEDIELAIKRELVRLPKLNPADITSKEYILNNVKFRLVQRGQEISSFCPKREFLDLDVLYAVSVYLDSEADGTYLLPMDQAEEVGITEEELYEAAMKNLEREEISVTPITSILLALLDNMKETMPEEIFDEKRSAILETGGKLPMFVVAGASNQSYGARLILSPENRKLIADRLDSSYIIIPSSVHEVICMPVLADITVDQINEVIGQVNAEELANEDILSEHAYFYDRNKGEISVWTTEADEAVNF